MKNKQLDNKSHENVPTQDFVCIRSMSMSDARSNISSSSNVKNNDKDSLNQKNATNIKNCNRSASFGNAKVGDSNILNGYFHKFQLEDEDSKTYTKNVSNLAENKNNLLLEMKSKDSNENEVIPMLEKKENHLVKNLVNYDVPKKEKSRCCSCCGPIVKISFGVFLVFLGIFMCIFTPFDFLMRERLKMMPGLPAYEWWLKPPDNVYFKIYIFNITNSERFLNQHDSILNFQEVGPIVYKELLDHTNVTFNNNDTLTYTARRWLNFITEENQHIDLNATIYVPNFVLLGLASYFHNSYFLTKAAFQLLRGSKSPVIVNTTIYNYLWNTNDPILNTIRDLAPGLVPIDNVGVLNTMYNDFTDEVTVYIGPNWGDEMFFTLDKFHGMSTLPGFNYGTCNNTLYKSTEGLIYSQRLSKQSKLHYWRKTLCQVVTLNYESEVDYNGVLAYKYVLPNETYHRSRSHGYPDCYAGDPLLVNGLSDVSKCFFDFPVAASLPHLIATDHRALTKISGMQPDLSKHSSYATVEPFTGTPLESCARSQSNLIIRKISGFATDIQLFSGMTLPMFWAEYSALTLPDYIWYLIIFTVKVVPIAQAILITVILLLGILLLLLGFKQSKCINSKSFHRQQQLDYFAKKTILNSDKGFFLVSKR